MESLTVVGAAETQARGVRGRREQLPALTMPNLRSLSRCGSVSLVSPF